MRKKSLYPYWALIPALLIFTLFTVVPLLASLFFSFTDWNILCAGISRHHQLHYAFEGPCVPALTDEHIHIRHLHHDPENGGRSCPGAAFGAEDSRQQCAAHHLLCAVRAECDSGGCFVQGHFVQNGPAEQCTGSTGRRRPHHGLACTLRHSLRLGHFDRKLDVGGLQHVYLYFGAAGRAQRLL